MNHHHNSPDPVMEAIIRSVGHWQATGDTALAREQLLDLWTGIGVTGDAFHRCVLAHYLADLYDDPAEALIWDVRALDAATAVPAQRAPDAHSGLDVAAFQPSLHLNLADNLRRLGSYAAAADHLKAATRSAHLLAEDAYGKLIRGMIGRIGEAIRREDRGELGEASVDARLFLSRVLRWAAGAAQRVTQHDLYLSVHAARLVVGPAGDGLVDGHSPPSTVTRP